MLPPRDSKGGCTGSLVGATVPTGGLTCIVDDATVVVDGTISVGVGVSVTTYRPICLVIFCLKYYII